MLELENTNQFGNNSKLAKKVRYGDRYRPAMISIRPVILDYIEKVVENTIYTKTQVIDKLFINGIRNTKF
jgi:hypothetical protein